MPHDSLEPHFKFLYDLLKDNYTDYSYYVFSTTSAILLIIGWLLTSSDARKYIAKHAGIKVCMIIGIVFFLAGEIYFSWKAKLNSDQIVQLLENTKDYAGALPAEYYRLKEVSWTGVAWFDIAHAVLYAILIWIICSISLATEADYELSD